MTGAEAAGWRASRASRSASSPTTGLSSAPTCAAPPAGGRWAEKLGETEWRGSVPAILAGGVEKTEAKANEEVERPPNDLVAPSIPLRPRRLSCP